MGWGGVCVDDASLLTSFIKKERLKCVYKVYGCIVCKMTITDL